MKSLNESVVLSSLPLKNIVSFENVREQMSGSNIIDQSAKNKCEESEKVTYLLCNAVCDSETEPRNILFKEKPFLIMEGLAAVLSIIKAEACFVIVRKELSGALKDEMKKWEAFLLNTEMVYVPEGIVYRENEHQKRFILEHLKQTGRIGEREFFEKENVEALFVEYSAEMLVSAALRLRGINDNKRLMYLCGDVEESGLIEIGEIQELLNFVSAENFMAVRINGLVGNYMFDFNDLSNYGTSYQNCLGNGEVKVYSQNNCTVDMAREAAGQLFRQSCGKCVFCREGLLQIHMILEDIAQSKGNYGEYETISGILNYLARFGRCDFGKGAAASLLSIIKNNQEEFDLHIDKKRCAALRCKGMYTVHIKGETCRGCGRCKEVCPQSAIMGSEGLIHVVQTEKCNNCMICEKECPHESVIRAGAVKPSLPSDPIPVGTFVAKKRGLMKR